MFFEPTICVILGVIAYFKIILIRSCYETSDAARFSYDGGNPKTSRSAMRSIHINSFLI